MDKVTEYQLRQMIRSNLIRVTKGSVRVLSNYDMETVENYIIAKGTGSIGINISFGNRLNIIDISTQDFKPRITICWIKFKLEDSHVVYFDEMNAVDMLTHKDLGYDKVADNLFDLLDEDIRDDVILRLHYLYMTD